MVQNLSDLYDATFKKNRGKAAQGLIRPTLSEFFMSHKDFVEVELESSPILNPETGGFLDVLTEHGGSGDYKEASSVNTLTSGKYYIEHKIWISTRASSVHLYIIDSNNANNYILIWGFNFNSWPDAYMVSEGDIIGYKIDVDNKEIGVYRNNNYVETKIWSFDSIYLKARSFCNSSASISTQIIPGPDFTYEVPEGYYYLRYN
jgi:hypothetical protein